MKLRTSSPNRFALSIDSTGSGPSEIPESAEFTDILDMDDSIEAVAASSSLLIAWLSYPEYVPRWVSSHKKEFLRFLIVP